jgi:hypothetical protein
MLLSDESPPQAILPEDRSDWVARDLWPFRPVLALRPAADGTRTFLSVPLEIPAHAHLRSAVAVHPEAWFRHPSSWVHFEIAIEVEGERTVIWERRLHTTSEFADRAWFEIDAPLERWAGRRVRLELSTAAQNASASSLLHAGFAEPRLVVSIPDSDPDALAGQR